MSRLTKTRKAVMSEVFIPEWGSSIPSEVVEAIRHKFAPDTELAEKIISSLQYDNVSGNWYFYHAGMYHGVEADGYIHT